MGVCGGDDTDRAWLERRLTSESLAGFLVNDLGVDTPAHQPISPTYRLTTVPHP
jgi:hypothetical protein